MLRRTPMFWPPPLSRPRASSRFVPISPRWRPHRALGYKPADFPKARHMALQDDATQDRNLRVMARWRSTARVLVEALPFILRYDRQTIVVKYGGHAMEGGVSEH